MDESSPNAVKGKWVRNLGRWVLLAAILAMIRECSKSRSGYIPQSSAGRVAVSDVVASGEIEDGNYNNRLLRFSIRLPANWRVVGSNSSEEGESNRDFAVTQNAEVQRKLRSAHTRTPTLFSATADQQVINATPPILKVMAEDISTNSSMDADDYLDVTKRSFSQFRGVVASFGLPYEMNCDGGSLRACDIQLTGDLVKAYMTLAVTIRDRFALTFALSGETSQDVDRIKDVLRGIKFD